MGFISDVLASRGANLENPNTRLTGATLSTIINSGAVAGTRTITPETSLALTSVYRAATLLSGTLAQLPLRVFDTDRNVVPLKVIDDPHPDLTPFELWERMAAAIVLWGNAYAEKRRNSRGEVIELWPINPERTRVGQLNPTSANPSGKTFFVRNTKTGVEVPLTSRDILHIPGWGYDGLIGASPITLARVAISAGLNAEEYSQKLWANGALMSGILRTPQRLTPEKAQELKQRWQEMIGGGLKHAHEIAVLDSGADFQPLTIPPEDAQFIETRKFQVMEIARLYGIPPHLLGEVDRTTSWGTGIEVQTRGLLTYTISPMLIRRIEARLTKELAPEGVSVEFVTDALLRGDSKSRAEFYSKALDPETGWMTRDEVRIRENLPPESM